MVRIAQVSAPTVWPVRHLAMYPGKDFSLIQLPADENGIHLALYAGEEPVSVISLFREGNGLQFRKFATLPSQQGKGYGSLLLRHVLRYAREKSIARVWCNARESAAPFYRRFGFRETDQRFRKEGISFVIMELQLESVLE